MNNMQEIMITELTPKQIKTLETVRDEWIGRLVDCKLRTDRTKATKAINWLYKFVGLEKPTIIFLSSPLAAQLGANFLKDPGLQVRSQVWSQVQSQVQNQVRNQVRNQVENQVQNQVRNQVRNQVWSQVESQVRSQVWSQNLTTFDWAYYGSVWDYSWVSFYDFFKQTKTVKFDKDSLENFNNFVFLLKSGIYDMIQLEKFVIVSDMPVSLKRDERGNLHATDGHAIEWADGTGYYFLSGVSFDKKLWKQVVNKQLTAKELLLIENMEQRMAALKIYGVESLVEELGAKTIDIQHGYELFEVRDVFSSTQYALKYTCPSTERVYVKWVDPRVAQNRDALQAIASTFGLSKEEYKNIRLHA